MPVFGGSVYNAAGTYEIDYACRFNSADSARLAKTPGSFTSLRIGSLDFWVKRGALNGVAQVIYSQVRTAPGTLAIMVRWNTTDTLSVTFEDAAGANIIARITTKVFRNPILPQHIHIDWNSNLTTDACCLVYIDGVQVTAFGTKTNPGAAVDLGFNTTNPLQIGRQGTTQYLDGYLSQFLLSDGTQFAHTVTGEFDDDGNWIPKLPSGITFGAAGAWLDFADSSNFGNDISGNANDWTATNFTTADQFSDTPTNDFCTLNPLLKYANVTTSDGNLLATPSGTNVQFIGTTFAIPTTGKWVWWAQRQSGSSVNLGIGDATAAVGLDVNQGTNLNFDVATGAFTKYYSGVSQSAPSSFTAPGASLMRLEYDADNDILYIYDDNSLVSTVNPTGIRANAVGPIFPIFGPYASTPATVLASFGANGYPDTPTTGYLPLCTANLTLANSLKGLTYQSGLETNLKLAMDAVDFREISYGQYWFDPLDTEDFSRGASATPSTDDPGYRGSAGDAAAYWSFDGGDFFKYLGASPETWMSNLHKDGATFTLIALVYLPTTTDQFLFATQTNGATTGMYLCLSGSSKIQLYVQNGASAVLSKSTDATVSASAWHFLAVSIEEAAGTGFFYKDGAYSQVGSADTFTSTYSSPSSSACQGLNLGSYTNNATPLANGSRLQGVIAFEGTALSKANLDTLYAAVKAARPGLSLP